MSFWSKNNPEEPSAAVIIELKDAVLLRVSEVDAAVDAVERQLLRRQQIVTTVQDAMHRTVHVRRGDTWAMEVTVGRLVALIHVEQQPTTQQTILLGCQRLFFHSYLYNAITVLNHQWLIFRMTVCDCPLPASRPVDFQANVLPPKVISA